MERKSKYVFMFLLFLIAISERIFLDLGPNIELVTMAMILSSFYFGRKDGVWLTMTIMLFSDFIIGNSNIFIFTWTGFLIPAIIASKLIKRFKAQGSNFRKKIFNSLSLTGAGLSANVFFYIWTNFGVWLIGSMYPKTSLGLISSYINALPFLRYQAISTLVFIPLGYLLTETAIKVFSKLTPNRVFPYISNFSKKN